MVTRPAKPAKVAPTSATASKKSASVTVHQGSSAAAQRIQPSAAWPPNAAQLKRRASMPDTTMDRWAERSHASCKALLCGRINPSSGAWAEAHFGRARATTRGTRRSTSAADAAVPEGASAACTASSGPCDSPRCVRSCGSARAGARRGTPAARDPDERVEGEDARLEEFESFRIRHDA